MSHSICVRTNAPLRATLGKAETSGRMIKWAIKLNEYDISYQPRSAIKAQALAEFVNEATFKEEDEGSWLLHVDSSSTLAGSGAGAILTSLEGDGLEYDLLFDFKTSNNKAEYEALIVGIRMALDAGARNLITYSDSQLVTKQVEGEYEVNEERMKEYLQEVETNWRKPLLDYLVKDVLPADEREAARLKSRAARDEKFKIFVLSKAFYNASRPSLTLKPTDRTTPHSTTGETPFNLVYESEVVIPVEAELETFRIQHYEQENNDNLLWANLDLLDEVREDVHIRTERYK
ncbi:UNVERIFIED_CONTAM: hypothetical protein Slati_0162300 [Sesamum latifolium]|uniref:RNase H type-1 domain-containing protein n=1 Tax=Sesamum latifolium TaxID=2727402 RepID=A0AAW2YAB6_9LAMI